MCAFRGNFKYPKKMFGSIVFAMAVFVTKVVYEICSVISFTKTPFNQDCLISLFLEMQRVFIHPMIAGCPDSMLTESTSWEDAFIQSSGKMLCLDYCLTCAKKVLSMNAFLF